ncbi:basic blue protein-like [Amaranthus tricolor]|uniref:basic blue protein-like n=1 Tax=Amaranthus tricolor TaxID=29722 RepID=UPI00258C436B|nr:basic blue protein-like [Amaranthus tricolor]
MGQGSGSARLGLAIGVTILSLFALTNPILAATYTVGGAGGWTFNVNNWPNGKSFKPGDVLAFNYDKTVHNVVAVSKRGYDSCNSPKGAKTYQTGKDRIKLNKGANYFICTIPTHCQSGMKISINAA